MNHTPATTINGTAYRVTKLPPLQAGRLAMRVAQALAGALADAEALAPLIASVKGRKGEPTKEAGAEDMLASVKGEATKAVGAMFADTPRLLAAMAGGVQKIDADALYSAALECLAGNLFTAEKLPDENALNRHFSEHPADLLPVMVWALRENCSGFFGIGARAST